MNRAAAAAGVAVSLAIGSLALKALWHFIPPAHAAIVPLQPIPVPTDWHVFGALCTATVLAGIVLATPFYRRAASADGSTWRSPWPIAAWTAVALACAWIAPALLSSDVYAYAVYGELARHGGNPYLHQMLPLGNQLYAAAIVQWGNPIPVCVYGLPFVALAAAVDAVAAPLGTAAMLDGFRATSSLALIALAPLAFFGFGGNRARRTAAAATIALNPVAVWCAAEGHNDAIAVAVAMAGFALLRRGRGVAGAALAALSGAVKLPGVLSAVPAARRGGAAIGGAAAGAALALLLSVSALGAIFNHITPGAHYLPQASLQGLVVAILAPTFGAAAGDAAAWIVAALAASACWLTAWRRLRCNGAEGWALAAVGAWLLVPNPYPWYGLWLLPIAAAAAGTPGAAALIGFSITSALRYFPDASGPPSIGGSIALGLVATLPVVLLLRRPRLV